MDTLFPMSRDLPTLSAAFLRLLDVYAAPVLSGEGSLANRIVLCVLCFTLKIWVSCALMIVAVASSAVGKLKDRVLPHLMLFSKTLCVYTASLSSSEGGLQSLSASSGACACMSRCTRYLVVAAYLASRVPPKLDVRMFTAGTGKRSRRSSAASSQAPVSLSS